MSIKPVVLFFHLGESSFVKEDLRILNGFSHLSVFHFKASRSPFTLAYNFIHQFFWLLINIKKADAIYCWFSDYHGFLPALFSKISGTPLLIVLGGFDCNKFEKFNYGIFCSKWRAPLGKFIIRNSTLLLPVNKTLIKTDRIAKNWPEAHPNGLSENIDHFKTPWKEVSTGYDPTKWSYSVDKRSRQAITVSFINSMKHVYVKGIDLFIESARNLPDFSFLIIGISDTMKVELKEQFNPPLNIEFKNSLPREQLFEFYQKASVYVQLSRTEGLPNVLCEAMLCGCVPVGSAVFGIPHGIGDAGYIVKSPDPIEISRLINKAHTKAPELREKARQRIINYFSLQQRENNLRNVLQEFRIINKDESTDKNK